VNGFLVLVRCTFDDIPAILCDTRDRAVAAAHSVNCGDFDNWSKVSRIDITDAVCIDVIEFSGGQPVDCFTVKDC